MKAVPLVILLVAACSDSEPAAPDAAPVDAPAPVPSTIGQVPAAERIAVVGPCVVTSAAATLHCVPFDGTPVFEIGTIDDRAIVEMVPEGADVVVSTTSTIAGANNVRLDRVTLGGRVTPLGTVTGASVGGYGLASFRDRFAFTTLGDLHTVPKAGGTVTRHASDGGRFGDVAVVDSTAYYVNTTLVYRYDLNTTGGRGQFLDQVFVQFDAELASDAGHAIAVSTTADMASTDVYLLPNGPALATLSGTHGRAVVRGDRAWVVAGDAIHEVDLTSGRSTAVVTGERAADLAVTEDALYWVTAEGAVRKLEI
ncbi:MAG: hypothetical protein ACTHU0_15845 [Kofleriaceae bacterium]